MEDTEKEILTTKDQSKTVFKKNKKTVSRRGKRIKRMVSNEIPRSLNLPLESNRIKAWLCAPTPISRFLHISEIPTKEKETQVSAPEDLKNIFIRQVEQISDLELILAKISEVGAHYIHSFNQHCITYESVKREYDILNNNAAALFFKIRETLDELNAGNKSHIYIAQKLKSIKNDMNENLVAKWREEISFDSKNPASKHGECKQILTTVIKNLNEFEIQ